jgi:RHS repeat-associated protein
MLRHQPALAPTSADFTFKERDPGTGFDYFGARYFAFPQGRRTSPDLINLTTARLVNPSNTLNKYAYAANNPLKYIDKDGEDATIFYRPSGYSTCDLGHIFICALNESTGQVGFLDYWELNGRDGPGEFNIGNMQDRATHIRQFLTLTIQTTPQVSQRVLDIIMKLTSSYPPDYDMITSNCVSLSQDVLHDLGLDCGDVFPRDYWAHGYRTFSVAQG